MKAQAQNILLDLYTELLEFVEQNGGWEKTTALVIARILTITVKYVIIPVSAIVIYLSVALYEGLLHINDGFTGYMAELQETEVEEGSLPISMNEFTGSVITEQDANFLQTVREEAAQMEEQQRVEGWDVDDETGPL